MATDDVRALAERLLASLRPLRDIAVDLQHKASSRRESAERVQRGGQAEWRAAAAMASRQAGREVPCLSPAERGAIAHRDGTIAAKYQRQAEQIEGLIHAVTALARAVLAQETRPTWQPIETAPKDGTRILVCGGALTRPQTAEWCDRVACWECDEGCLEDWSMYRGEEDEVQGPQFWMPLPAPPDQPREEKA